MLKNKRLKIFIMSFTVCALFTAGFANNSSSSVVEVMAAGLLVDDTPAGVPAFEQQSISQTIKDVEQIAAQEKKKAEEKAAKEAEEKARAEKEQAEKEQAMREQAEAEAAAAAQNQAEQELMASIIFCEAGNQSYEGQVAVGAVIMNRVRSASYPDSIEEVIYQPGQFGPAITGWLDKVRSSGGYTDSAMQAARDALSGANPIGGCLYFDQGNSGYQIGDHFFH